MLRILPGPAPQLEVGGHLGGDGLDVDVVEEALVRVDQ